MRFRGTRADLVRSLRLIPLVLRGDHHDALGLREVFWNRIGNCVLNLCERDFKTKASGGAGADGIHWQALAATTLERRARKGVAGTEILVEYGDLLASLRPGHDDVPSGALNQVFRLEPKGVTVGSADPKADHQQDGVPGRIPARPFIPNDIPPGWLAAFDAAVEGAMEKVIELIVANGGIS